MARELWPLLTPDDRVVADRLFLSHADLAAVAATGAHAIFRVKSDVDLPVLRVLPDGDYLSRIADPAQAKSLRRKKTAPADIPDIPVRVIECSVSADDDADAVPGNCSVWPPPCSTTGPTRWPSFPTAAPNAGNWRPRSAGWRP